MSDTWQPILDAIAGAGVDPAEVALGSVWRGGYVEKRHPDPATTITVERAWPSPVSLEHVARVLAAEQLRPRS